MMPGIWGNGTVLALAAATAMPGADSWQHRYGGVDRTAPREKSKPKPKRAWKGSKAARRASRTRRK